MKTMILSPIGWSRGGMLRVGAIALALALSGCGGGSSSPPSVVSQIQTLVATGSATDLQTATDLLLTNQDSMSAADFEAAMSALAQA